MRIVLAADGSKSTKKALAYLATHGELAGPGDEVLVLNVQPALAPRVRSAVGARVADNYHREEAEKVLAPIRKFLERQEIPFRCEWKAGNPAAQIVAAADRIKAGLVLMGTHGYGLLGRVVMGSVATRVVSESKVPVLLVK
jgi:nucleotide-binding universal stress UspA family protein